MTISLSAELESVIAEKVRSGRFRSAGEVVRESLRLLDEQDRLREIRLADLKKEIQKGEDDIAAGRFVTVETEEDRRKLADRIIANGTRKMEERLKRRDNGSV